jgi:hypothetical protein
VAFRITARRNGYTNSEGVQDFLLLRAAELAISPGRKGFIITVVADQSRVDQHCAADSTSVIVPLTEFHPIAIYLDSHPSNKLGLMPGTRNVIDCRTLLRAPKTMRRDNWSFAKCTELKLLTKISSNSRPFAL